MTIDIEAADAAVYDENIAQWNVEEWQRRAERAEAEAERLRDELNVTRSLLRGAIDGPLMWYEDIAEYLEALD